jgi:hypothetical protein
VQRLHEGQDVLVQVHLRMAVCTVAGLSGGDAVLRLTPRQHGGPLPDDAHDAQLTFIDALERYVLAALAGAASDVSSKPS